MPKKPKEEVKPFNVWHDPSAPGEEFEHADSMNRLKEVDHRILADCYAAAILKLSELGVETVSLENPLKVQLAATKKELADAKEMIASVKSTADCREQMIDEAIQEMNKAEQRARVAELRARVAELRARASWRPIETAPKDCSRIQGYSDAWKDVFIVKWSPIRPAPHWTLDSGEVTTRHPPTHWMPLPAAPKPEDGTGEIPDDPFSSEEHAKFVESMIPHCHCAERNRPCDGVLAGGLCDNIHDDKPEEYEDDL